jgi:uncharacterized Zn finger protein (UPF0148 family)
MELKSVACPSCGAPLDVPPNVNTLTCMYCGKRLTVDRGQSHLALKTVEEVSKKFEDVGDRTQQAIREGTYATQAELKRLQLSQDLSAAQMQLSSTQAEIRSLERQKQNRRTKEQLRELRQQEQSSIQRIKNLQAALASTPGSGGTGAAAGVTTVAGYGPKDWTVALALCALLGWLGAHRFYTGHTLIGVLQLVTVGGAGIWWLIDLVMIISGKYKDSKGYPLGNRNPAMGSSFGWALGAFFVVIFLGSIMVGGLASDGGSAVVLLALVVGATVFFFKYRRARRAEG